MKQVLTLLVLIALPPFCSLAIVDVDGDGMSDLWEVKFFGGTDPGGFVPDWAPLADPDGDGRSNAAESIAGTDPLDPSRYGAGQGYPSGVFSADLEPAAGPGEPELLWWGFFGKSYQVESGADPLSFGVEGGPGAGGDSEMSFLPLATAPKRFWRVVVSDIYSDADALTDWEENEVGTSPVNADHEGDGMWDDYEVANGLDPFTDDTGIDRDEDGLGNGVEHGLGTEAGNPDTDEDGLRDGYEVQSGSDPLVHDDEFVPAGPAGLVVFTPARRLAL